MEVVVVTIHHPLPAAITSTPELRLTHRLRIREALFTLYISILALRYGYQAFPLILPFQICENQGFLTLVDFWISMIWWLMLVEVDEAKARNAQWSGGTAHACNELGIQRPQKRVFEALESTLSVQS
ncbi:hypothetical protein PIB30_072911 [Stylosanthes scabra]|uniref:Uncharacterized protein n=1 Tax=Stylosanthes scabra TaxID=79078 RepID=A0ABU6RP63_9FABA|nr:hypothetical protein [Stylosanthes scabra]